MSNIAIRRGDQGDRTGVEACVNAAYRMYIPRMGKQPAPMLADYARLIDRGEVYVAGPSDDIQGVLVIEPRSDHLFIENVAVRPDLQGSGLGSRLLAYAEEQARFLGLSELRLYTHERMTENLAYYPKRGYEEVARREEDGYARVFMSKRLQ